MTVGRPGVGPRGRGPGASGPRRGYRTRRTGNALPAVLLTAAAWYDGHDGSGLQEVPSRNGGGRLITLGSTTGSDTNDPTWTNAATPYWACGGTDDYLQQPAADTPTFTQTTGDFTVLVVLSFTNGSSARVIWSSHSASDNGAMIFMDPGGTFNVRVGTSVTQRVTKAHGTSYNDGTLRAYALVQSSGTVAAYSTRDGLSTTSSTSGLTGTMTHTSPRVGTFAYTVSNAYLGNVHSIVQWDSALTGSQLAAVSSYLLGAYS